MRRLIPLWLSQLKKLLAVGLKNLRILLLKIPKLSAFRVGRSSFFHLMIADGKKVFLKKLCHGNTINISRRIRKCKKPSTFENFLVVEFLF